MSTLSVNSLNELNRTTQRLIVILQDVMQQYFERVHKICLEEYSHFFFKRAYEGALQCIPLLNSDVVRANYDHVVLMNKDFRKLFEAVFTDYVHVKPAEKTFLGTEAPSYFLHKFLSNISERLLTFLKKDGPYQQGILLDISEGDRHELTKNAMRRALEATYQHLVSRVRETTKHLRDDQLDDETAQALKEIGKHIEEKARTGGSIVGRSRVSTSVKSRDAPRADPEITSDDSVSTIGLGKNPTAFEQEMRHLQETKFRGELFSADQAEDHGGEDRGEERSADRGADQVPELSADHTKAASDHTKDHKSQVSRISAVPRKDPQPSQRESVVGSVVGSAAGSVTARNKSREDRDVLGRMKTYEEKTESREDRTLSREDRTLSREDRTSSREDRSAHRTGDDSSRVSRAHERSPPRRSSREYDDSSRVSREHHSEERHSEERHSGDRRSGERHSGEKEPRYSSRSSRHHDEDDASRASRGYDDSSRVSRGMSRAEVKEPRLATRTRLEAHHGSSRDGNGEGASVCSRVSSVPSQLSRARPIRPLEDILNDEDDLSVLSRVSDLGVPSRRGLSTKK